MPIHRLHLTIDERVKSIPYPAASGDGYQTFAFKPLKGKLDKISKIHEAKDHKPMVDILSVLNRDESPFFSIGCEKAFNGGGRSHWVRGFFEFAYNYVEGVSDATNYFPIFFYFNKKVHGHLEQNGISYWFKLEGAHFKKADTPGYTCCIYITTDEFPTSEIAYSKWTAGIKVLSDHLETYSTQDNLTQIYGKKS